MISNNNNAYKGQVEFNKNHFGEKVLFSYMMIIEHREKINTRLVGIKD